MVKGIWFRRLRWERISSTPFCAFKGHLIVGKVNVMLGDTRRWFKGVPPVTMVWSFRLYMRGLTRVFSSTPSSLVSPSMGGCLFGFCPGRDECWTWKVGIVTGCLPGFLGGPETFWHLVCVSTSIALYISTITFGVWQSIGIKSRRKLFLLYQISPVPKLLRRRIPWTEPTLLANSTE